MIRSAAVLAALALICLQAKPAFPEAMPVLSDTGPDAAAYGAGDGYPVGTLKTLGRQGTMVGTYSHYDQLRPFHIVAPSSHPSALDRAPAEIALTYNFQGETRDVGAYLARNPATGLLMLQGRTILLEHYRYGRTDRDRFVTQSVSKTVVALLLGVALADGSVKSVDDAVATYVPELAGTELGRTPLKALLTMRSGIAFREAYDGKDDIAHLGRALMHPDGASTLAVLAKFNRRVAPPGQVFNFSGLDTELLSLVIARATHHTLAELLQTRLWEPLGAEASANWTIDAYGTEVAYCCLSAVLRDWGRLAALLAADGMWDGKQVLPRSFLIEATTPPSPGLSAGTAVGYGYQIWLLPGERRQFVLRGNAGQAIFVDPESHLAMVHTAVRPTSTTQAAEAELMALWNALVEARSK